MVGGVRVVAVEEPDRSEFIRDAEAALRVGNPRAARAFLMRLCRRRASVELYEEHRHRGITKAEIDAMHRERARQLYGLCEQLGFLETKLTCVMIGSQRTSLKM